MWFGVGRWGRRSRSIEGSEGLFRVHGDEEENDGKADEDCIEECTLHTNLHQGLPIEQSY